MVRKRRRLGPCAAADDSEEPRPVERVRAIARRRRREVGPGVGLRQEGWEEGAGNGLRAPAPAVLGRVALAWRWVGAASSGCCGLRIKGLLGKDVMLEEVQDRSRLR